MSFLGIHVLTDAQFAALKAAGHEVESVALSAGQHAVAILKAAPVGQQIVSMIQTVNDKTMTGAQKFAAVLAQAIPLVTSAVADHGVTLVATVEDTAREVIQSLFNDLFSGAAKAASGIATAS
jgi:siderophore synthetase component